MIVDGELVNQNQGNSMNPDSTPPSEPTPIETKKAQTGASLLPVASETVPHDNAPCAGVSAALASPNPKSDLDWSVASTTSQAHQNDLSPNCHGEVDAKIIDAGASQFQKLDPRSAKLATIVWLIQNSVLSIVVVVGCLLFWLIGRSEHPVLVWIATIGAGILICTLFWLAVFIPQKSYAMTSYRLQSHGLEIRRGIWWKHWIFIPANRIQHSDVHQGPIERRFELATLTVNTGGTHKPSISLPGLNLAQAEQLRDQMSKPDSEHHSDRVSLRRNLS